MINHAACPICDSVSTRDLFPPIVECMHCGLARTQLENLPEPDRIYARTYFTERNEYLARAEEFGTMFEVLIDMVQLNKPSGDLLDIGCGPGLLLNVARRRGYRVSGCDIAEWAIERARQSGLEVKLGELESIHYADQRFDVITINHTLEHVPHPTDLLVEAHRILKADGILFIGVPNFESWMAKIMRGRWAGLLPDQHLWHFTPRTLRRILERANFSIYTLAAMPSSHSHPNWVKQIILNVLTTVGNSVKRGESLVAIAAKAPYPC